VPAAGLPPEAGPDDPSLFAVPDDQAGPNAERIAAGLPPRGRPPSPGRTEAQRERRRQREAKPKADKAPTSTRSTSGPPRGRGKFRPALIEYVGSVGGLLTMAGVVRGNDVLTYDGQILLAGAEDWADAMEALAAENPQVRRVLEVVVATSAWSQVVTTTAAMVVPILAAHRILPPIAATVFGADLPPEPPAKAPIYDEETGVRVDGQSERVRPAGTTGDNWAAHMANGSPASGSDPQG